MNDIELLAPAGDWEAFVAAVENGADAVYLGGRLFNARQFAGNFDNEQLKKALNYAHVRGVKVYLTMNTLLSDSELKQAVDFAGEAYIMGIDGIIVQDLGFAGLIRELYPGLDLHASTQMTIYNLEGVRTLEKLGFKRIVLARELGIDEIRNIAQNTSLEIEVFIHGALCISYSGQCLMSSIIGGRSGNRGKCAQPCRLPYELVGENRDGSYKGYLLSPKDLCSVNMLDSIINAGVKSFKIEGRMKSPEYVAAVTGIYRQYLDAVVKSEKHAQGKDFVDKKDIKNLMQVFNRGGFHSGYLQGKAGRDMMCYEKPKNWGVYLGEVISYDRYSGMVKIKLDDELSTGDGMEVWNGEEESPGAIITEIKINGRNKDSANKGDIVTAGSIKGKIRNGDKVYKTSDKRLNTALRESFTGKFRRKVPLKASVVINRKTPIALTVYDNEGNIVTIESASVPEKALNRPITEEKVMEQLRKTGSTPFEFDEIEIKLDDDLSVPVSVINDIRRKALEDMETKKAEKYKRVYISDAPDTANMEKAFDELPIGGKPAGNTRMKIAAYFYSLNNDCDYSKLKVDRLYLPFASMLDEKTRQAVSGYRQNGMEVYMWLPYITRGNYDTLIKSKLEQISQSGLDGILAGNAGSIMQVKEQIAQRDLKIAGDYSLNIFNRYSVKQMLKLGLSSVTISPELNLAQIGDAVKAAALPVEAIVYGRLPLMASEYCPVGSIKGDFTSRRKCHEACKNDKYRLRDRKGMEFPVLCDRIDCRSTILNSNVIFIPDTIERLKKSGVDTIRLYITDDEPSDIREIVEMHRDLVDNGPNAVEKHQRLVDRIKVKGFTKGHYYRGV